MGKAKGEAHYFSTHGCRRVVSSFVLVEALALEEAALAAAAACRARISKKLAIVRVV